MSEPLHKAQASILYSLRHTQVARYSDLRQPTGLDSDVFKFHMRKLQNLGYLEKRADGAYQLTTTGKEFANNLDANRRVTQKQPKLSVFIVGTRVGTSGETLYLLQRRLRQPFFNYWGCMSGPVQWGQDIVATTAVEFKKQTNLDAQFDIRAFYRKYDYDSDHNLLEDKLFAIVEATNITGNPTNEWPFGFNQWVSAADLQNEVLYFDDTLQVIEALRANVTYLTGQGHHISKDY